jgi:hypothetical protein
MANIAKIKANKPKQNLGAPRQIRLDPALEKDLQEIADQNGIDWVDAVRMCARFGVAELKRRLGDTVKKAA